jgi:hypothetical protein
MSTPYILSAPFASKPSPESELPFPFCGPGKYFVHGLSLWIDAVTICTVESGKTRGGGGEDA